MKKLLFGNWVARLAWLMMLTWPMVGADCFPGDEVRGFDHEFVISKVDTATKTVVEMRHVAYHVDYPGYGKCGSKTTFSDPSRSLFACLDGDLKNGNGAVLNCGYGLCFWNFNKNNDSLMMSYLNLSTWRIESLIGMVPNGLKESIYSNLGPTTCMHFDGERFTFNDGKGAYLELSNNGFGSSIAKKYEYESDRSFEIDSLFIRDLISDRINHFICHSKCENLDSLYNYFNLYLVHNSCVDYIGGNIIVYDMDKTVIWGGK